MSGKSQRSRAQAVQPPTSSGSPTTPAGFAGGSGPRLHSPGCTCGQKAKEVERRDEFSESRGISISLAKAVERLAIKEKMLRQWEGEGILEIKGRKGERPGRGGPGGKGFAIPLYDVRLFELARAFGYEEGREGVRAKFGPIAENDLHADRVIPRDDPHKFDRTRGDSIEPWGMLTSDQKPSAIEASLRNQVAGYILKCPFEVLVEVFRLITCHFKASVH